MARLTCALGPDAAGTELTAFIAAAADRLDAAVYEVGPYYAWTFDAAARRGTTVRLVVDRHAEGNRETAEWLRREKSAVVPRVAHIPNGAMHSKLLLANHDRIAVGTGNLIERDARRDPDGHIPFADPSAAIGTREWWLFAEDVPTLTADARRYFRAIWSAAAPVQSVWALEELPPDDVVHAPQPLIGPLRLELQPRRITLHQGGAAVQAFVRGRLEGARHRVDIQVPYVHAAAPRVRHLLEAVGAAVQRGVPVRLLLGSAAASESDLHTLTALGIEARVMDNVRCTVGHTKGVVIDNVAVVGSANWSEAGMSYGIETALSVADARVADYFSEAVSHDWETGRPV